jgi:methylated-DNA-protein-cysteine methyltransferase-like protein
MFQNPKEAQSSISLGMKKRTISTDRKETPDKSNFFEDVFDVVRQIPKGRVTNYGSIAKYLGSGLSSRMVGWAMNASHMMKPKVPAHRVVNRNGMLTGKHHFPTPTTMETLLEKEGVKVISDKVVEFKERYWDPAVGLL